MPSNMLEERGSQLHWRNLETRIHLMVCSSLARIFLLERRKSHWELKGETRQKFVFELDETSTAASSRAAEKQLHLKLNNCSNRGDSGWTEVCYVKWLLFSEILYLVKTPRGSVGILTTFLVRYWEARRTCVIGTGKQTEEKVKSWHSCFCLSRKYLCNGTCTRAGIFIVFGKDNQHFFFRFIYKKNNNQVWSSLRYTSIILGAQYGL
jgi:hypothetical protein